MKEQLVTAKLGFFNHPNAYIEFSIELFNFQLEIYGFSFAEPSF